MVFTVIQTITTACYINVDNIAMICKDTVEKGEYGDRPRTGIRSAKVSKGDHAKILWGYANYIPQTRGIHGKELHSEKTVLMKM